VPFKQRRNGPGCNLLYDLSSATHGNEKNDSNESKNDYTSSIFALFINKRKLSIRNQALMSKPPLELLMSEWNNGPKEWVSRSAALIPGDWINHTSTFGHTKVKEHWKVNLLGPFNTFCTHRCSTTEHLEYLNRLHDMCPTRLIRFGLPCLHETFENPWDASKGGCLCGDGCIQKLGRKKESCGKCSTQQPRVWPR
jgi:hypothetical protein